MMRRRSRLAALLLLGLGGCTLPQPPVAPVIAAPGTPPTAPPPAATAATAAPPAAVGDAAAAANSPRPTGDLRPAAAAADDGFIAEVLVTARDLGGFWAVTAPSSIDLETGLLSGIRIRTSGEPHDRDICRISHRDGRLRATCIASVAPTAEGSADGEQVSLRWWVGPATLIFRGAWDQAATIGGALSGGMAGLSVTGEVAATLHKLSPPETEAVDRPSATMMQAVFDDLRRGGLSADRYEGTAGKRLQPAFSWAAAKDANHHLRYLGQIHIRWHRWQSETVQDVYEVQSGEDRSLCRIALTAPGRVVDFACESEED